MKQAFQRAFFGDRPKTRAFSPICDYFSIHRTLLTVNDSRVLVLTRALVVASVLVTASVLGVRSRGVLQPMEIAAFDWMMRQRPDAGPDSRFLVVGISEADIRKQKRWPLSDRVLAQLLTKLEQFQPKVIGLDLYRDIPEDPGHAELSAKFQTSNIIAITNLGTSDKNRVPPPHSVPEDRVGFNDVILDGDGVIRRNLIFGSLDSPDSSEELQVFNSFSFRLALAYLKPLGLLPKNDPNNPDLIRWGKAQLLPLEANSGGYANNDANGYQILLNYRTKGQIARTITLTDILHGQVDPSWVKDKIVLIGTTAPSAKDLYPIPYSAAKRDVAKVPGVMIHAQMVSQFIDAATGDRPLFWYWPEWGEAIWIGGWALAGGLLVASIGHPWRLGLAASLGFGALLGISFFLFTQAGWVPVVPAVLAFGITGGAVGAYKLRYDAFHDALTGLPNRDFLIALPSLKFSRARGLQNTACALLFLDLDNFKMVNDSMGQKVVAQLLVAIAHRLKACLRDRHKSQAAKQNSSPFSLLPFPFSLFPSPFILARVGGDEFAILLKSISDDNLAIDFAQQLHKEFELAFNLNGQEIFITTSIGIAVGTTKNCPELLRNAETAMYRARAKGRGRSQLFETAILTNAVSRLQLENDLRRAIEREEFLVFYQPIISLSTGKIAGFEALVRWKHPQRGLVFPGDFIGVAEESGLIVSLGAWVLRESCRQMKIWHERFPAKPPLIISVNLSGKQFSQKDLVSQIEATQQQTGIDASCLKLEITESVVMEDMESAIEMLLRLRSLNVQLGIDDFGTGYSSLSYLHRFPTNTLKVDRSFVSRLQEGGEYREIVRTIVTLAHNLSMDAIAEGVETAEQMESLRSLGCEYGQGYFFAKPLPSDAAEALLASHPQW